MDIKRTSYKVKFEFEYKHQPAMLYYIYKIKGGIIMLKLLAKIAEKYAISKNTACFFFGVLHQPKMPASLIKRD